MLRHVVAEARLFTILFVKVLDQLDVTRFLANTIIDSIEHAKELGMREIWAPATIRDLIHTGCAHDSVAAIYMGAASTPFLDPTFQDVADLPTP